MNKNTALTVLDIGTSAFKCGSVDFKREELFCFHLSQIEKQVKAEKLYISGSMTKSAVWVDLLKENVDKQIILNNSREAGLVGAVKIYNRKKEKEQ